MAEPKCPDCSTAGTKHVVSAASKEESKQGAPWFHIAYCDVCGHVYGVFTKHIFGKSGPQLIVENKK